MKKKAFTLIELLIFMALLSVLLVVMTQLFVSVLDSRSDAESVSSVEQDSDYLLARLMYDMGRSTAISLPAAAGAQGSTLRITVGGVNYTYTLTGTNLEVTTPTGINRLNSLNTTVSNLLFKRIGAGDAKDTIQVSFTLTSSILKNEGYETKNFQTTISSRQ